MHRDHVVPGSAVLAGITVLRAMACINRHPKDKKKEAVHWGPPQLLSPYLIVRHRYGALIVPVRIVVVRVRSRAERCRSYRASRSDRAAYDARRNVARPKTGPVTVSGTVSITVGGSIPVTVGVMVHPLSQQLVLCCCSRRRLGEGRSRHRYCQRRYCGDLLGVHPNLHPVYHPSGPTKTERKRFGELPGFSITDQSGSVPTWRVGSRASRRAG